MKLVLFLCVNKNSVVVVKFCSVCINVYENFVLLNKFFEKEICFFEFLLKIK